MAFIEINGGKQLNGEVNIQGSKNAALPILAATVLINGIIKLNHCPQILDVFHMIKILEAVGCNVWWENSSLIIDTTKLDTSTVPNDAFLHNINGCALRPYSFGYYNIPGRLYHWCKTNRFPFKRFSGYEYLVGRRGRADQVYHKRY